jgi:hypothetical protein
VLRNQTLAARETTDVLLLTLAGPQSKNLSLMQTLGYALQIAGARLLELDTRELGVMVASSAEFSERLGAVTYDNVPGGAGHVRELFDRKREWLKEALSVLFVDERHDARCETACLDCLLTFDAQDAMNRGLLQRRKASRLLEDLLNGRGPMLETPESENTNASTNEISPSEVITDRPLNNQERLLRGRSRLRRQRPHSN